MFTQSNNDYHADISRISNSGLKEIAKSPHHYYEKYLAPNGLSPERKEAFIIGDAVDTAILDQERFRTDYVVEPRVNKRKKAGREALQEFADNQPPETVILTPKQYEEVCRTRDAVLNHPTARMLLEEGTTQQVVHWTDPLTGAPCKLKYDWLRPDGILIDLKTARDASELAFAKQAYNLRYHVQAPFYVDGFWHGEGVNIEEFLFLVVEKQNLKEGLLPSSKKVAIRSVGADEMKIGRETYQRDLEVYQQCRTTGRWPGYSQKIEPLILPGYAYKYDK